MTVVSVLALMLHFPLSCALQFMILSDQFCTDAFGILVSWFKGGVGDYVDHRTSYFGNPSVCYGVWSGARCTATDHPHPGYAGLEIEGCCPVCKCMGG